MHDNPRTILKNLLTDQEQHILADFRQDKRWAILELARANDAYLLYTLSKKEGQPDVRGDVFYNQYYQFGWTKSLSLFMSKDCMEKGVPLTPSTPESQQWADSMIIQCGKLGICEILLEYDRFGLGELSNPKDNEIHFVIRATNAGIEKLERYEFDYLNELAADLGTDSWSKVLKMRSKIMKKMSALVQPRWQHYIHYQTAPEIDAYYQRFGLLWSRTHCLGHDSFPNEATFAGKSFGLYKAAIVNLVGFAWKHIDFCQSLLLKHPDLELRNLLTIYCHINDLCEDMAAALEVSSQEASHILSLFTLTPNNKSIHVLTPRNYSPPLIQISEESVINSISGILSDSPYLFLLEELRNLYPNDWYKYVNLREETFRIELYQFFPSERFFMIEKPVKIKVEDKVITDIDAIILDKKTGTLCLFQLKWQDFFASSMQKRESGKKNLMKTANAWISSVSNWLADKDHRAIGKLLGFDLNNIAITHILLFVIGRNFAHFSGDEQPDDRAAWGMWPQIIRLINDGSKNKVLYTSDPLGWIHTSLRMESSTHKEFALLGQEFQLGGYRIVLESSK
ncbi:MAG: hypothetical protein WC370_00115 [Dehalococcoidales bacterium]|jgi:hypothetical protein